MLNNKQKIKNQKKYLSLIVPFFNESDKIESTYRDIVKFFEKQSYNYEIIFVVNSWIKLILGSKISDHQTGLKIFKSKIFKKTVKKIKSNGWLFDVELLYYLQLEGAKIVEVPITVKYGFEKIKKSFIVDFIK